VTLGLYNLLGLNDILSAGFNQDLQFGNHDLGTHGWNASYSIPWGYWTGTLYGYTNTYYQQIAGVNTVFNASGNAQTAGLKLERVFHRSQNDVSGVEFQLIKRFGASFIEDTEIKQQQRDNTFIEAGLTNRHYLGAAQFDGTLAYRQGIGAFGAQPDTPGGPTYRFHMATLDANLSVPFKIANQSLRYVGTVHGQFTNDELNYIDDLTIGSRYTVRGFSGQTMLAAEKGFYWRNELQMALGGTGQSVYAGVDYGHLWGPSAAYLTGTQLAGAVLGLRGGIPSRLGSYSYDVFIGTPIYAPAGFPASRVTLGFQLTGQF
jgi:hemolysin activation/secretion protein